MKRQFFAFIIRWVLNSLGLWIAVRIFGTGYIGVQPDMSIAVFLLAGLIFSVVNAVFKPIAIIPLFSSRSVSLPSLSMALWSIFH